QTHVGKGVSGVINQLDVAIGDAKMLEDFNLKSGAFSDKAETLRKQGETVMFIIVNKQIAGLISVTDTIKANAHTAIKALQKQGMNIVMVTGDNRTTAEIIANKLGITSIEAGILPH